MKLTNAADGGHREIVISLIREGADINAADENGRTALMWAIEKRHRKIIEILIKAGADPKITDNQGRTARDDYIGNTEEFDRIVEKAERERAERRMVKVARASPSRSRRSRS